MTELSDGPPWMQVESQPNPFTLSLGMLCLMCVTVQRSNFSASVKFCTRAAALTSKGKAVSQNVSCSTGEPSAHVAIGGVGGPGGGLGGLGGLGAAATMQFAEGFWKDPLPVVLLQAMPASDWRARQRKRQR